MLDGQKDRYVANKTKLKGLVQYLIGNSRRLILQAKITGAWLRVRVTKVSGTVISATKFLDFLCAHYNAFPLNLQIHCDGCGTIFRVTQTLSCSINGLVIACDKRIRDGLLYLYRCDFTPASVRSEPLLHQVCTISEQEIRQVSDKDKETWGDVMI